MRKLAVVVGIFLIGASAAGLAFALRQQPTAAPAVEPVAKEFENRVKLYVDLRDKLENSAPKLKDKATPEEIAAHRTALAASIRQARTAAKPGDIFFPQIAAHIRAVVVDDMRGRKGAPARKMSNQGDPKVEGSPKPVRVQVNAIYPDSAPNSSVPPDLLAKLPALPEELQYRFVGRDLILRDATANIIVDYIRNVTP